MPRRRNRRASTGAMGPGRPTHLASAVRGLQMYLDQMIGQRDALDTEIQTIQRALATVSGRSLAAAPRATGVGAFIRGGPPAPPPGKRRRGAPPLHGGWRSGSLKDHIAGVLRGGDVMSVKDITDGVLKGGYKTANKTLAKSVGIALTEMRGVEKMGRGRFRLLK